MLEDLLEKLRGVSPLMSTATGSTIPAGTGMPWTGPLGRPSAQMQGANPSTVVSGPAPVSPWKAPTSLAPPPVTQGSYDLEGKIGMPASPLIQATGYSALASPGGTIFGTSNYQAPKAIMGATPLARAYEAMLNKDGGDTRHSTGIQTVTAPPIVASTSTGLPGTFNGAAAPGSSGWFSDNKGGSMSQPDALTAQANDRIRKREELDQHNRVSIMKDTNRTVPGAPQHIDAPSRQAQIDTEKKSIQEEQASNARSKELQDATNKADIAKQNYIAAHPGDNSEMDISKMSKEEKEKKKTFLQDQLKKLNS